AIAGRTAIAQHLLVHRPGLLLTDADPEAERRVISRFGYDHRAFEQTGFDVADLLIVIPPGAVRIDGLKAIFCPVIGEEGKADALLAIGGVEAGNPDEQQRIVP